MAALVGKRRRLHSPREADRTTVSGPGWQDIRTHGYSQPARTVGGRCRGDHDLACASRAALLRRAGDQRLYRCED
ncbi:hypothetical protein DPMN_161010 [Dreissena polymorpha]|uniref:Uncharacterized protein n=1 Tax=Dreissena polymorpha TaxID=45954 RepID=A0A9D4IS88_DREPO|nr:hypothetical protein DPMN_161010 [Dreissena polymorpha]